MKIIAIGRNYTAHIEELNNEKPSEPVIFMKPDTAVLRNNAPFYYPEFSKDIHFEVEILVKINREGKFIQEKFAQKYYDEIGIGIDFTARDVQSKLKEKGLPWDKAKGFNGAAPISDFVKKEDFDLTNLNFSLTQNGEEKQQGNTKLMLYTIDEIIAYVSQYFTLKKGDIIFTGTPKGVGPVAIGDKLEAYIEGKKMLEVEIK
ncbi:fumarylacetoacetate hydrolase family protein [Roseivirga pacifica]|uniref:fumarylacetoacetate hydrolase family protein n=1 Tax=Roseivirga pacifica TaxID=1267423 RepID=UPI002095220E|nr:fumarylacetoacetate hydrolase family protein [Roseivirga pacifica]MCO6357205.1 2-hydroxyhepta-2,4-diene-1,7-dioate isomerase [Roseivirga pacifica]MCO6368081.1 2-hydroxyhepta-2,4-diene-1,7-dioate isomerase [Roseivirga pacifica]MCO6369437.1 2-hydroxyhepta-2,4-diene-1,7-dioate isomerase [Roseivirga pacifica]MCO6373291.1 2-hydroxyhepta-2,4-diene-1,7-dioate isomerase [Roseivirga pacifica]MCO6377452.1 2-hydroxyhepta-2,4-diene-1,7-dioate isomerase [Roseivirga pacifica]